MDKIFCVISHTHWDREWYMPFEQFRIRLIDLMDNLLQVIEENPQYIFHLDAQTIVLEDYLEIRPYRREALKKYIAEGRILVGPWYVQNDFYLTSGEATIRNLLTGSKIADEMGKCTWVGYAPDQFGLISQLPQIFNGFGIDNCIFGRGYSFYEKIDGAPKRIPLPSEFIWKSGDGSEVLAVHMPFWYNNAQRFSEDMTKSMKLLQKIEKSFEGIALTPYLLLMNGVDHLEAQENLLPILKRLDKALPEGRKIHQASMEEYLKDVNRYLKNAGVREQVRVYDGELRNGVDYEILQGTLSSRIYLKTANVKAQNLLESNLEPLYSFIHAAGAEPVYPADYLHYLWKLLMQNHPHDSICGCSRDEVHRHMEDRFERINETGLELLKRGMDFIAAHADRSGLTEKDYLIALFNTVETARDTVAEVELQFPVEEAVECFGIFDADGSLVPYALLSRSKKQKDIFSPINLPGVREVDIFKVQLYVSGFAGPGCRILTVKPSSIKPAGNIGSPDKRKRPVSLPVSFKNESISVMINPDGSVDLTYLETGRQYKNILRFEDTEDCGCSYVYEKAQDGKTITADGIIPEISCLMETPFETRYGITYNIKLPEYFDESKKMRSEKLADNRIQVVLGLQKGCKRLDMDFHIENTSRDHRLRALVTTGIDTDFTRAYAPFDVIERDRRDVLSGIKNGTQPNSGFVDISDGREGIAILNEGIFEYEHLMDNAGIIAITLLRANGKISANSRSDQWTLTGNQCLREIELKASLYPHKGDWNTSDVLYSMKEFLNPVLFCFQPVDIKKFVGGRPAVQESDIAELFYRADPFKNVVLPHKLRFFEIKGKGIYVSAVKKSVKDGSLVIRLVNSSGEDSSFELAYFKPLQLACKLNMKEDIIKELEVSGNTVGIIGMKPGEIFTLAIK